MAAGLLKEPKVELLAGPVICMSANLVLLAGDADL